MNVSAQGLMLIQRFEGFSPVVYRCPAGIPTIGYGHVVRDVQAFADGMDEAEAGRLLEADVRIAEWAVRRLIDVRLTQGQFDALVSFTFNLGSGRLQSSTLRRVVNRVEHAEVPRQFVRWVYADGRKLPGLVRRRMEESIIYQSV